MARTMFAPGILWGSGAKLEVIGSENIAPDQPYVFIANHLSYLDIPVLFAAVPHNLHFVAKKEVKKMPFIGWYMMATGMIFVDRSDRSKAKASMMKAAKLVHKGKDVLMFPEGTRSRNGKLQSFKKGAFILAQNAKVPVIPIALCGTDKVLKTDQFLLSPGKISVHIGQPIKGEELDSTDFTEKARKEVQSLHDRLQTA